MDMWFDSSALPNLPSKGPFSHSKESRKMLGYLGVDYFDGMTNIRLLTLLILDSTFLVGIPLGKVDGIRIFKE